MYSYLQWGEARGEFGPPKYLNLEVESRQIGDAPACARFPSVGPATHVSFALEEDPFGSH